MPKKPLQLMMSSSPTSSAYQMYLSHLVGPAQIWGCRRRAALSSVVSAVQAPLSYERAAVRIMGQRASNNRGILMEMSSSLGSTWGIRKCGNMGMLVEACSSLGGTPGSGISMAMGGAPTQGTMRKGTGVGMGMRARMCHPGLRIH